MASAARRVRSKNSRLKAPRITTNPMTVRTSSVTSRLIAAPIAPFWCTFWKYGISARFISGLITQASAIAFVHSICCRRAIRIWLTMMFRYIGGTQRASTIITGMAGPNSGP